MYFVFEANLVLCCRENLPKESWSFSREMFHIQKAAVVIDNFGSQLQKLSVCCSRGFKHSTRRFQEANEEIKGTPYSKLTIGVPKETFLNVRRVAIVPATVQTLTKKGFNVKIEENAGVEAKFTNDSYVAAGASLTDICGIIPLLYTQIKQSRGNHV